MKKIPKKLLDECIEASRLYWNSSYEEGAKQDIKLELKIEAAKELGKQIKVSHYALQQFVDGILNGICPDAENDEIYCTLRTLGWEPTE